jgi:fructose-1,6-bisphosphatase/inositol monophosphatase family enzyme
MIDLLVEAADAVSDAVSKLERSRFAERVGMGADGTPTQRIDVVAEEAVFSVLEKHGNPLNVLSEERGFVNNGAGQTLVLDPLDGTFNAAQGIPFFATSLAVGKRKLSDIQYAVVKNLVTGTTYTAERGEGAFSNGNRLKTRTLGKHSVFGVYIGNMAEDASFRIAKLGRRARNFGAAALELCFVAQGSLDAYYLYTNASAKLRVMDIAAGTLIVREAGGEVLDPDGRVLDVPLDMKTRTDILAIGDRKVLEVIK